MQFPIISEKTNVTNVTQELLKLLDEAVALYNNGSLIANSAEDSTPMSESDKFFNSVIFTLTVVTTIGKKCFFA